jgi:drug/metabolite transporter (DMT)-like permease
MSFFTVLLGPIFLREYPDLKIGILTLTSFFGIVLIANPSMIGLGSVIQGTKQENTPFLMLFFALLTGLGGALMTILLRFFATTFLPCYNLFSFGLAVTMYSSLFMMFTEGKIQPDGTHGFYLSGFRDLVLSILVGCIASSY